MIVHRILNVVFRTLDAVDAVRARVDSALGKHAEQPSSWPPQADPVSASRVDLEGEPASDPIASARVEIHAAAPAATMQKDKVKKAKTPQKAAAKAAVKPSKPTLRQPAAGRTKRAGAARKGSVDRKGVDVDSPRARAIQTFLKDNGTGVVTQDASLDSKKTVARVLWAVAVAEAAGSGGLSHWIDRQMASRVEGRVSSVGLRLSVLHGLSRRRQLTAQSRTGNRRSGPQGRGFCC